LPKIWGPRLPNPQDWRLCWRRSRALKTVIFYSRPFSFDL